MVAGPRVRVILGGKFSSLDWTSIAIVGWVLVWSSPRHATMHVLYIYSKGAYIFLSKKPIFHLFVDQHTPPSMHVHRTLYYQQRYEHVIHHLPQHCYWLTYYILLSFILWEGIQWIPFRFVLHAHA